MPQPKQRIKDEQELVAKEALRKGAARFRCGTERGLLLPVGRRGTIRASISELCEPATPELEPCPSCTSLMDGFDRVAVAQDAAFATIAKAAGKIDAWANAAGQAFRSSGYGRRQADTTHDKIHFFTKHEDFSFLNGNHQPCRHCVAYELMDKGA